jgi:hypothetical protein
MGNHAHILLICMDSEQCKRFYQEVQKKITDAFKQLLGCDRLSLWEGDPCVAQILDEESAIKRIAYIYANPARAGLVSTISEYPGVSSWEAFDSCGSNVSEKVSKIIPRTQLPLIDKLPSLTISDRQDAHFTAKLRRRCKGSHSLDIYPNAWMKCFKISDKEEVIAKNRQIRAALSEHETNAAQKRTIPVIGAHRLKRQAILRPHTPKKKERGLFFYANTAQLRVQFLEQYRLFVERCAECYENWCKGDYRVGWPPGAFRPPITPIVNALG